MIYKVKEKNIKKLKTYLNSESETEKAAILFYNEICKKI